MKRAIFPRIVPTRPPRPPRRAHHDDMDVIRPAPAEEAAHVAADTPVAPGAASPFNSLPVAHRAPELVVYSPQAVLRGSVHRYVSHGGEVDGHDGGAAWAGARPTPPDASGKAPAGTRPGSRLSEACAPRILAPRGPRRHSHS